MGYYTDNGEHHKKDMNGRPQYGYETAIPIRFETAFDALYTIIGGQTNEEMKGKYSRRDAEILEQLARRVMESTK